MSNQPDHLQLGDAPLVRNPKESEVIGRPCCLSLPDRGPVVFVALGSLGIPNSAKDERVWSSKSAEKFKEQKHVAVGSKSQTQVAGKQHFCQTPTTPTKSALPLTLHSNFLTNKRRGQSSACSAHIRPSRRSLTFIGPVG